MIRAKELSPVDATEHYLERIERLDKGLNAFVTVAADRALDQAREAEAAVARGDELSPLHGVVIPIKDLFETEGIRTTGSCAALADYVPETDHHGVASIKAAGGIVIGKTNTSEFGTVPMTESMLNGATRNPWKDGISPGGSSGGAAVAVAAGLAPVAHGSDGGGSVRIPASCCGLYAIKPSRGRISSGPVLGEAWHGFATQGAIGRTVADTAALIDCMQGYHTGDPYTAPPPARPYREEVDTAPGKLRVGYTLTSPNEVDVAPDCVAALEDAAKLLEELGHEVEEAAPEGWVNPSMQPQFVQLISTGMAILDFLPHDQLEPLNRYLLESANGITSVAHMTALTAEHAWARQIISWWDSFDILLTPTLAMPPVDIGWVFEDDDPFMALVRSGMFIPFTPPFNVTGQPAASVPLYWNENDVPIGVQIVAAPYREDLLVRLSGQLEDARPWADRRPPGV